MQRRGILDDTLIIVTSDHGENFGEDGLIAHGFSVDERLIHMPLVMAGPGARMRRPFSLAELPALIGRAAGIDDTRGAPRAAGGRGGGPVRPDGAPGDPRIREFASGGSSMPPRSSV